MPSIRKNGKRMSKKMSKKMSKRNSKSKHTARVRRNSKKMSKAKAQSKRRKSKRSNKMIGGGGCFRIKIADPKGEIRICNNVLAVIKKKLIDIINTKESLNLTPQEKKDAIDFANNLSEYANKGAPRDSPPGLTKAFTVLSEDPQLENLTVLNFIPA